jgi:hypothetical protein
MKSSRTASLLLLAAALAACGESGMIAPSDPAEPDAARAHRHDAAGAMAQPIEHTAEQNRINARIRQATAPYQRIERALAAGYVLASECVESPLGGMGYHFVRFDLIDGVIDPENPEALVYAPQPNGRLRLVAVEFIVPAAAWPGPEAPALGGVPFDDHTAPGSPGPPFPHYQLHAWVWQHNPAGIYTQFNPDVSCEFAAVEP